jgi:hypothetical protein
MTTSSSTSSDLLDVVVVSTRASDSDANAALEQLLKDDPEVLVWLLDYKKKTILGDAPSPAFLGTETNNNSNNMTLRSNKTKPLQQVLVQVLSLVHHPLVLLDIALMILGNGMLTPWSFHIHRRLLLVLPWIGRRSTGRLALLVKSTKHAMQSLGKVARKLYKRRSQYSVLSDYTWYVNSSNPEEQHEDEDEPPSRAMPTETVRDSTSIIDLQPTSSSGRQ